MKTCSKCKTSKPITDFYNRKSRCKLCSNQESLKWKAENKERYRLSRQRSKLKSNYGITLEYYNSMVEEQKGVCYICKSDNSAKRNLNVDHCHKTGKIRRLLCDRCNMTLGLVNDSIELLKHFIHYLK